MLWYQGLRDGTRATSVGAEWTRGREESACLLSESTTGCIDMKASMASLDHEYEGAITISHLRVLGSMVALATSKAELEKLGA